MCALSVNATGLVLPGIVTGDFLCGIPAVSGDDYESPVVFSGPAGSFVPVGAPAPRPSN